MNQKKKSKISILISSVAICILCFLLMVIYIPKIFGYKTYYIQSGSMGSEIPTGCAVLDKSVEFEEINVGDVLTFKNDEETECFTHRVIEIDEANQMFTTKGDANSEQDPAPISYYFVCGRVDFVIPYIGYLMNFLNTSVGKIIVACIYIAWIAIEIEIIVMKRKAPQED